MDSKLICGGVKNNHINSIKYHVTVLVIYLFIYLYILVAIGVVI